MSYLEITMKETLTLGTSDSVLFTYDLTEWLPGSITVASVSGTDDGVALGVTADAVFTIGTPSINEAVVTASNGDEIAIGKAVHVRLKAPNGVVGTVYDVRCIFTTSAGNRYSAVAKVQVVN